MRAHASLRKYLGLAACLSLFAACSESAGDGEPNGPDTVGKVSTFDAGDGVFGRQIDATDDAAWVYLSLADGLEVDPGADPFDSDAWDLAFRRSNIKVNGGFSGTGEVAIAPIATDDFDSVTVAPVTSYESDTIKDGVNPDQPDFVNDDNTDFIFRRENSASINGWFVYDSVNHVLSAADVVYVIRARDGTYYKFQFLFYYDQAGTAGFPTFRYTPVDPPDPAASGFELDASDQDTPIFVDLATRSKVSVSDPATSTDWDVMVSRTSFATNSGVSGPGLGGAQWAPDADFVGAKEASTIGFVTDTLVPPAGPPVPPEQWVAGNRALGDWFDYEPSTMTVTPKEGFFIVRDAEGTGYYKLKIFLYEDGIYRMDIGPVDRDPSPRAVTVTATDAVAWRYVSLRSGQMVAETASTTTDWDVAFSQTRVRTNSGTSGDGAGGAVEVPGTPYVDITQAPSGTYTTDEFVGSNEPGEPDYSGNVVLGSWFDYDETNDVISARDTAFAIRLGDGTFAKVKVDGFDDGIYTLRLVYAGPVGDSFE